MPELGTQLSDRTADGAAAACILASHAVIRRAERVAGNGDKVVRMT
jgi:hypothetical protein